jgi:hypothetical protein
VVVVGGLVGGVVVGGTVVGGAVVGVAVVGGVVVGEGDVPGVDLVTDGTVVGDEVPLPELLPALVPDGDVVVGLVLGLVFVFVLVLVLVPVPVPVPVLVPVPAPPVELALDADLTADDFPSESTANQSFSTPCPASWPFFVSLTKWYSA